MIRKRYQLNLMFECPDAILTCSILRCQEKNFLIFGGHDKILYLMDETMNIVDDRAFDGWVRCSYPIDLDDDGCDEVLVGAGDGNFMVLKLNPEKKKLVGIMRYKSKKRINCCTAGDFTRNGNIELIFGSEDKTLKIFDNIQAKEPKYILYYDSWVIVCTLGFLKLPDEEEPIFGLLVGTRNGLVQLIRFKEGLPEIIWQNDFLTQINDIKIGDITNDGLNEILLSTNDSTIKILNAEGEKIKEILIEDGRPLSLLVEDVDGDNANEIVAGCADGSLKVFHNPTLNSTDIELKWKTKVSTSIKHICYQLDRKENKKNIIFGGYDRAIRFITDFEWGEKQPLDIQPQIEIPATQSAEKEKMIDVLGKIKEVPSTMREEIFQFLLEKGYLKEIVSKLSNSGYSEDEILDELALLKTQKSVTYERVVYPLYSLPEEEMEVPEEIVEVEEPIPPEKTKVKHMVVEEPIITDKEKLRAVLPTSIERETTKEKVSGGDSLRDNIIAFLKQKKLIATKGEFINGILEKGFSHNEIEKEINLLKEKGIIHYSRAKPKGWSLIE
ncbi:MAG: hypothetical protein ACFFB8_04775 [Promethearchaeota archaeon]